MYNPGTGFSVGQHNVGTGLSKIKGKFKGTLEGDVIGNVTGQVSDLSNHDVASQTELDNAFDAINHNQSSTNTLFTTVASLQGQIDSNDVEIAALQTLQGQITSNDSDIQALQTTTQPLPAQMLAVETRTGKLSFNGEEFNGKLVTAADGFTGPHRATINSVIEKVNTTYLRGTIPSSGTNHTISTTISGKHYVCVTGVKALITKADALPISQWVINTSTNQISFPISSSDHGGSYTFKIEHY